MATEPVFCFIDDSPFERDLFDEVFARHVTDVAFVVGATFDEVSAILRARDLQPSLFILDLYGRTGQVESPQIPDLQDLQRRADAIPGLAGVYADLERAAIDDPDLRVNEYLKRLFQVVSGWRELFADVAADLDQSPAYGLANLRRARARFPGVPAVGYTRKAVLADAIRLQAEGGDGIYMKPGTGTDTQIRDATIAQRDELLRAWRLLL